MGRGGKGPRANSGLSLLRLWLGFVFYYLSFIDFFLVFLFVFLNFLLFYIPPHTIVFSSSLSFAMLYLPGSPYSFVPV